MYKKLVIVVLAAAMLLSSCGANTPTTEDSKAETEKVDSTKADEKTDEKTDVKDDETKEIKEITFISRVDATVEDTVLANLDGESMEDNRWTQRIAEETGYQIVYKWIVRDEDQFKQKLNAALASGDIPDIMSLDNVQLKQAIDADLLADMGDVFDKHASPLLKGIIEEAGSAPIQAATVDGVQYGIPVIDADAEMSFLLWLRTDWLEEADLTAPSTIDELIEVAKAFKEIAGEGGYGLGVEKDPFGRRTVFHLEGLFNAFGAYPEYWMEDESGDLVYGNTTEEFREALGVVADMYQLGLIDQEFTVKDGGKVAEDVVAGKIGMYYGPHWTPGWPLQDNVNNDPDADWKPFAIPTVDGSDPRPGAELATTQWYVASAASEYPEALVEIMSLYCDLIFDQDKQEFEHYSAAPGADGGTIPTWRLSPIFQYTVNKNINIAEQIKPHLESGDPGDLFGESLSTFENTYAAMNGDRANWSAMRIFGIGGASEMQGEYWNKNLLNMNKFFGSSTETMITHKTILDNAFDEAVLKVITGQQSLEEFDQSVQAWFDGGGTAITEEVNAWYAENK